MMMSFELLIRNGTVVLPDEIVKTDIGIYKGKIVAIGNLASENAAKTIAAEGRTIFPGMIDVHVHFDEPGRTEWEGFDTGSSMLAAGGCTAYFDMPLNGIPPTVTRKALVEKVKIGETESHLDFGLWGGLVPGNLDDLEELKKSGVIGFKAFLSPSGNPEFAAVDDLSLLAGMRKIAALDGILALHAESGPMVTFLQREKERQGQTGYDDYAASRPPLAEVEAVSRALLYARLTGCRLHFVHISTAPAVDRIRRAKRSGQDVTLETCAHYLLYNHADFRRLGAVGKCAPPLRSEKERCELVDRLIRGDIDMVTSDHSPCTWKDKQAGTIFAAWGGISGGQFTLQSVVEIALRHHLSLTRVAELTAARPAERFGLAPTKGAIRQGADADLAILDLQKPERVTQEHLFQKNKFSLYVGHIFPASVIATINRGAVVYADGRIETAVRGRRLIPHTAKSLSVKK
jgi:allantoinase